MLPPSHHPSVLIVDDDPAFLDLAGAYLEDHFAVTFATDARDGLAKFNHRAFDAVIVDRAMPELLGDQFALQIKERAPHVPIILVTGFRGAPIDTTSFACVLLKPFTQAQLLDALRDALPAAGMA